MIRNRLSEYLQEHNISQRELAAMTKLSEASISRICNNERGGQLYTWFRLCSALGCSIDEIIILDHNKEV